MPKQPQMPASSGTMNGGKHPMTDAQMTKMMGSSKPKPK